MHTRVPTTVAMVLVATAKALLAPMMPMMLTTSTAEDDRGETTTTVLVSDNRSPTVAEDDVLPYRISWMGNSWSGAPCGDPAAFINSARCWMHYQTQGMHVSQAGDVYLSSYADEAGLFFEALTPDGALAGAPQGHSDVFPQIRGAFPSCPVTSDENYIFTYVNLARCPEKLNPCPIFGIARYNKTTLSPAPFKGGAEWPGFGSYDARFLGHVKFLTHNLPQTGGNPAGLAACGGEVYLGDSLNGSLRVFDTESMNETRRIVGAVSTSATTVGLTCSAAAHIQVVSVHPHDGDSRMEKAETILEEHGAVVWLLQCTTSSNCTAASLTATATVVAGPIQLADGTSSIAVDPLSHTLFAAAASGVAVYDVSSDNNISFVGMFGHLARDVGGDLQTTPATFLTPNAVGVGAGGSVVVSHFRSWVRRVDLPPGTARPTNAHGWVTAASGMKLGWDRMSLAWMQTADTSRVNTSVVHTDFFSFEVDWSKSSDSNRADTGFWRPLAYTLSNSPDDARLNTSRNWTPFVRALDGRDFMWKSDQGTNVMFYRQDGLVWTPCGYLGCMRCNYYPGWPWTSGAPNNTGGFFLWTDTNGDGRMQETEFVSLPQLPDTNLRASSTWIGEDGSITLRTGDVGGRVAQLRVTGLNTVGCPVYAQTALNLTAPAPQFFEDGLANHTGCVQGCHQYGRQAYLSHSDTLLVASFTRDREALVVRPYIGGEVGSVACLYPNISALGNTTEWPKPSLCFDIEHSQPYVNGMPYPAAGDPAVGLPPAYKCNPRSQVCIRNFTHGMAVAGDCLFVTMGSEPCAVPWAPHGQDGWASCPGGLIDVYSLGGPNAGRRLGVMNPANHSWIGPPGFTDINYPLNCHALADGSIQCLQEDVYYGKITVFLLASGICARSL